jgi:TPR repeat protein
MMWLLLVLLAVAPLLIKQLLQIHARSKAAPKPAPESGSKPTGRTVHGESKYARYIEDRAKHMDELGTTYQSWHSSTNPQTLFNLAKVYLDNTHPSYPTNVPTALKYLQLAAAQDHGEAHAYIALFHLAGIGFLQSPATAYSILHTRAEAGCVQSMFFLANVHVLGTEASRGDSPLPCIIPGQAFDSRHFNIDTIQFVPSEETALALLLRSAELGCAAAQDSLSFAYLSGGLVQQSFDQAFHWATEFSQSADQMRFQDNGGISLHLRDALAYIDCSSTEAIDFVELKQLLQPACDEGSGHAWYLMGLVHRKQNHNGQAHFCFFKAAVRGSPEGQYEVGLHHYTQPTPNYKQAAHWLQLAASATHSQPNPGAMFTLAEMYKQGRHFPMDDKRATQLYLAAAELGHQSAQLCVGILYDNGTSVSKSIRTALEWYHKVANPPSTSTADAIKSSPHSKAQLSLRNIGAAQGRIAQIYLHGDPTTGLPASPVTALKYYQLAAEEAGEADVLHQRNLGMILSTMNRSTGSQSLSNELLDDATAIQWLTKAANRNDTDSQVALGLHLYRGLGVKHDVPAAVAWWRHAVDLGSARAAYELGSLHVSGEHPHIVPKDKDEGIRLMTFAAEQGLLQSQLWLGRFFEDARANSKAEKWYTAAAAQDSAEGKYQLACFYYGAPSYIPPTMTEKKIDLKILNNYSGAAKGGYLDAKLALYGLFLQGYRSIPKDHRKALTFLVGCVNSDPNLKSDPSAATLRACCLCGIALNSGIPHSLINTPLGFTTALEWYTFGAEHGGAECQARLADIYYEGTHGIKQDYALASHWLHQCLKQGHHPDGVSLLGKMQHRGVFVRPPESDEDE